MNKSLLLVSDLAGTVRKAKVFIEENEIRAQVSTWARFYLFWCQIRVASRYPSPMRKRLEPTRDALLSISSKIFESQMATASLDRTATIDSRALDIDIQAFLNEGAIVADGSQAWVAWGKSERAAAPNPTRLSIYAPDFFLSDPLPWHVFEHAAVVDVAELEASFIQLVEVPDAHWQTSAFSELGDSFADIQQRIADGSLDKAVPFAVRQAQVQLGPKARAWLLSRALRASRGEALIPYGIWDASAGMIGITPESLFSERNGGISAMALAGTRARTASSLLNDPKEMHEHRIVVQGIVERLAPLADVHVGETRELELPSLVHLLTPIDAVPHRAMGFPEWVTALHPTAAIGAWPKEAGWEWLKRQPNAGLRGRYGAPFGILPPESSGQSLGQCLVAIRNVQWEGDAARIIAGGGIVAESKVEREWREFNAKMDSIQGALGL